MLLLSILPAIILLMYICKRSPVEVPVSWIVKASLFGVVSAILSSLVGYTFNYIHEEYIWFIPVVGSIFEAFFVAAIPEELCKLLMLWLIVDQYPFVDDYTDCILFSVAIGLGFAAYENVFYVTDGGGGWLFIVVMRGLISVPGHYAFAVLMGYCYSLYYFDRDRYGKYRWLALVVPVIAHGIYDSLLMLGNQANDVIKSLLVIAFIVFVYRLHKHSHLKLKCAFQRDLNHGSIQ